MQSGNLIHPKYRPDIDGLRAIAVLSVVIYHAFPNWLRGGFIGVDIFFVISGFLISTIIISNLERNTFSFIEFYSRRIKRIFPALILVLISSFVFGWFTLLADEYKQLGKHMAGGAGFISNFLFWNESGYFDNSANTKPLLHLWSLGIEEQFYIVWPLLLWLAWKKQFNLLTIATIVAIISFTLNLNKVHSDAVTAFYSPQTRFWELLIGSVLAYLTLHGRSLFPKLKHQLDSWLGKMIYAQTPDANGKTLRNVQSILGAVLILIGVLIITKARQFPGWWALLPTLGAVLIISAGTQAWFNRAVLSNRILVWFGLISFPLYLWHWPLLSFTHIMESDASSRKIRIAAVLLAIILAWVTYKFIEKPMRFGKYSKMKIIALVVLMTIVGYVGFNTYAMDGFKFRVGVLKFNTISKAAGEWQYPGDLKEYPFKNKYFYHQESKKKDTTLFVGDSNIEQYYVRIDELIKRNSQTTNSIIFATGGGCLPIIDSPYDDLHKHCFGLMDAAFELASARKEIKTVVIGAQWNGYLSSGSALKGSFGYASDQYKNSLLKFADYIRDLKKLNKQVFVILNIPAETEMDPKYMASRELKNFPNFLKLRDGGVSMKKITDKYGLIQNDLQRVAEEAGAIVINPLVFVCKSNTCPSLDSNGEPIYKDSAHLRPYYVRNKASFIDITVTTP
ncbi:MAG: acyltransferase [Methylophilaceae bacterium]|nr:acyltransferase [Methylophilaceae bacterium]